MRYKGILVSFDEYMNFLLNDCEEWIDDTRKGKLGKVFIRCNNVLYISQAEEKNTGYESSSLNEE